MLKLYVVIREDLKPGLELAQGIHAAVELAILKPEDALAWRRESQNVAALGAADEAGLRQALDRVREMGARPARFHEPDLGGALTGFAFIADDSSAEARALSSLPLALKTIQRAA